MSMFKQKLSIRTQIQLAELLGEAKERAIQIDPEGVNTWTGEFVLWYDDNQRFPRLAVYLDHSIPAKADGSTSGSGFGQWWTKLDGQLVADESLDFLMRG